LDIHQIARRPAQKAFRDMAATGIAGAEDQDCGSGWICHVAI
jgi:hypothetical protein